MGLTLFMGIWIPLGLLFRIDISHSFGLVRNHFLFDHGEAKSRHAHQVAFGTYGKLISTVITRYARIKTENSARSSLFDADDTVIDEELLKEWEEEEIERQRQEAEDRIKELTEEGAEDEIPAYMLSMLQEFQHEEIEDAVPEAKLPVLAIIGRPNTGKSTIFNRLTSSFKDGAIVHDEPGITRDRTYRGGSWNDYNFQVVDTGGIIFDDTQDIFAERILEQALIALREADAAILVCDGQEGLTQLDEIITDWLRKNSKVPLYIAVNKCESETQGLAQAQEFWALGFGAPFPVSGIHGTGLGELLDVVTTKHMTKIKNIIKEDATNVALVGRPNVGKSSLFNRLYGQDRAMVSDVAGTTRDTVDALLRRVSKPKIPRKKSGDKMRSMSTNPTPASSSSSGSGSAGSSNRVSCDSDQVAKRLDTDSSSSSSNSSMDLSSASTNSSGVTSVYRFIDTAGIRKRGKVSYGPEFFMVNRAFKAIRRAEVVVLVLDATTGLVDQDRILAERIAADGRACVIALNKWDAVPDKDDRSYIKATENIRQHLPALRWAEVALVSALTGQRTDSLLDYIDRAAVQFRRRISTAVLNEVVNDATNWMSPPAIGARAGRIYYCLQVSTAPPTIVFFVNDPALFTDNYQRFLERKIRDALDFEGTPIRMIWRGKSIRDVGRAVKKGALGAAASAVMKSGRFRDVGTSKER